MTRQAVAAALATVAAPQRRIDVAGGTFAMGSDDPTYAADREGPVRAVSVAGFAIDAYAVTNARFAAFVVATDHRSDAERLGGSFVFQGQLPSAALSRYQSVPNAPWWRYVPGAAWFAPEGPGSDPLARADHPVVHVSWSDAVAFATWAGGRLPSEAEWEYAARGGLEGARYPWGDELEPGGVHRCNVWQGRFPDHDSGADGYRGTAPVDAYEPNGFGLYNVVGNVWEWCADAFGGREPQRVRKGGSFLCHHSYCRRYRNAARTSGLDTDTATNVGVRVAYALERASALTSHPPG